MGLLSHSIVLERNHMLTVAVLRGGGWGHLRTDSIYWLALSRLAHFAFPGWQDPPPAVLTAADLATASLATHLTSYALPRSPGWRGSSCAQPDAAGERAESRV